MRFHLARRFCHQIFTWISDRCNERAISERSPNDKYFFCWNSASSSISCSLEKAVRLRRVDDDIFVVLLTDDDTDELSSSSLSLVVKLFESWLTKLKKLGRENRYEFTKMIYLFSFVRVVVDLKKFEIMDSDKMLVRFCFHDD